MRAQLVLLLLLLLALAGGRSAALGAGGADVAGARKEIQRFRALPRFVAPGPPFDVGKLRGKTIFEIPITSEVPFVTAVEKGMRQAAAQVGAKLVVYPNQGQPTQWSQGIAAAVAQRVDAITLLAQDPAIVGPAIRRATDAGIPVIVLRTTGEHETCPRDRRGMTYGAGCVPGPFEKAGRLEADWVIQASKGRADVLVISSNDARSTKPLMAGLRSEFALRCPSCSVRVIDVPISQWATRLRSEVQSTLVRDPGINYVVPIYDSMAQFVVPAIKARKAERRVRIATFNGTPFVLGMMQREDLVAMDVGEDLAWLGWAAMDQAFRAVAGVPLVRSEHTPLRVFDDGNVAQAGNPPRFDAGYGRPYVAGYRRLWRR